MKYIQNNIKFLFPNTCYECSEANESQTDGDIGEMGKRLAKEVEACIKQKWPRGDLKKLSFIGHSLGGVIIRAALPHLKRHKDKMYSYMSFSSPHLGCSNGSKLISTGKNLIPTLLRESS